jgi:hypothetical protein
MDFSSRDNGVEIRDKFEAILDELQMDDVLNSWALQRKSMKTKSGKKVG